MNKPELLVVDIDGTLVNDQRELLPYTKQILNVLHQNGVRFGIASGRESNQLETYKEKWGLDFDFDMIIGLNGDELFIPETKEYSCSYYLKPEQTKQIMEVMRPFTNCVAFFLHNGDMFANRMSEGMKRSMERNSAEVSIVDEAFFWKEDRLKLLFRFECKEDLDEVLSKLVLPEGCSFRHLRTQPFMLEFMDSRIDKANALIKFCEQYGIDLKNVIAAGDTTNDNGMLKAAGLGICLANGTEDTMACADVVTELDNNHEGLAHYLEEHVLNSLCMEEKKDDLICLDCIRVNIDAKDWKEAIQKAGGLLEDRGSIAGKYIEEMIAAVEKLGPYIVLMPGFALGHSEPSDAVYRNDVSVITLKEPVNFGSHNDPVKVVMCLACVDKQAHIANLQNIAMKLMSEGMLEKITNCQSNEELYQLMNQ